MRFVAIVVIWALMMILAFTSRRFAKEPFSVDTPYAVQNPDGYGRIPWPNLWQFINSNNGELSNCPSGRQHESDNILDPECDVTTTDYYFYEHGVPKVASSVGGDPDPESVSGLPLTENDIPASAPASALDYCSLNWQKYTYESESGTYDLGDNVYSLHHDMSATIDGLDDCENAGYMTVSGSDPPTVQLDKRTRITVHVEQQYGGYTYLPQYQLDYSTADGFYAEVEGAASRVVHNVNTVDECIRQCDVLNNDASSDSINYRCKGVAVSTKGEDVTTCKRNGIDGTQLCPGNCIVYREYLGDDTFESSSRAVKDNFKRLHFRKNGSQSESGIANNCALTLTRDADASTADLEVGVLTGSATVGDDVGTHPCHQRNKVVLVPSDTYTSEAGWNYTHQSEHWYDKLDVRDSISTTGINTLKECIKACDDENAEPGTEGFKCKGVSYATGNNNVPDLTSKCALWGSKMGAWTFSHEATNGADEFSLIHMKHDNAHLAEETVGACPPRTVYKPDEVQIAYENVADENRELDKQTQYYAVPIISSNVDPTYANYRNGVCEYPYTTWSENLPDACEKFGGLTQCTDTANPFVYTSALPSLGPLNQWMNVPSPQPVGYCTRADCKTLEKACALSETTYAVNPDGRAVDPGWVGNYDEYSPFLWKQMEYELITHTCIKTMGEDGVCSCESPLDGNTYHPTSVEACDAHWGSLSLANEPVCDDNTYMRPGTDPQDYSFADEDRGIQTRKRGSTTDKCVLSNCIYNLGESTDMYDEAITLLDTANIVSGGSGKPASEFMDDIRTVLRLGETTQHIRSALVESHLGYGYNARPELHTSGSIFSLCKKQTALMNATGLPATINIDDIKNADTYGVLSGLLSATNTLAPSYMRTITFGGTTVGSSDDASEIVRALLEDIKAFEVVEGTTVDSLQSDTPLFSKLRERQHALFCKYESTATLRNNDDIVGIDAYISNMTAEAQKLEVDAAWTDIKGVARLHRYIKNHFAVALLIQHICSYIANIDTLRGTAETVKSDADRYLKMRLLKFASGTDYKWSVAPDQHAELKDDAFFNEVHTWNTSTYETKFSQAKTALENALNLNLEDSIDANATLYNVVFHICVPLIEWLGNVALLIEAETRIILTYVNIQLATTVCSVPYYKTTAEGKQHQWEFGDTTYGDPTYTNTYDTPIGNESADCVGYGAGTHAVGTYTLMTRLPIEETTIDGTLRMTDAFDVECTHTVPTDGQQPSRNDACKRDDALFDDTSCGSIAPVTREYLSKHWCELRCKRFRCFGEVTAD